MQLFKDGPVRVSAAQIFSCIIAYYSVPFRGKSGLNFDMQKRLFGVKLHSSNPI